MALGTARYSTSLPYLKAKWLGTLIHLCCNSHLSCVCPFRLLKQKHHRPGGSFFILRVLTEGWLLYRISWFSVIEKQESSMGSPMPPPSRNFIPFPSPSHLSSWSQSPCLSSLSHTANFNAALHRVQVLRDFLWWEKLEEGVDCKPRSHCSDRWPCPP